VTVQKKKKRSNWLTTIGGILLAIASVVKVYEIPTGKLGKATGGDLAGVAGSIIIGAAAADARNTKRKDEVE
jgi:hypothetical protein